MALGKSILLLLYFVVRSGNATNDTTTSTPTNAMTTTLFFTSADIYQTDGTFSPTMEPTLSPVSDPTPEPTPAPQIPIPDNNAQTYTLGTTCRGTTRQQVENNIDFFTEAGQESACGDASEEECKVSIGDIIEVIEETTTTRRRILETEVVGVTIEYLVVIYSATIVNDFNDRVNDGDFVDDLETLLSDNFDGITVDEDVTLTDEGIKSEDEIDEFVGIEEETFGEKFEPGFIFGGIISSIVGVVWILFLRSNIANKYPSYLGQPAAAAFQGGNAVEMVPQTSTASATAVSDAEQKRKNKQELQQAWNESDAD